MMGERPAAGICRANGKSAIMDTRRYGSMAEQRFCKPWVGGSTPSTGSRNFFRGRVLRGRGLDCEERLRHPLRPADVLTS